MRKIFFSVAMVIGLLFVGQAWALEKDGNGVYQIGSAKDLVDFAKLVNIGSSGDAVLTADIDLAGVNWTPIGNENYEYAGTFDGQGYAIKNLVIDNDKNEQALFGGAGAATIKNLIIDASCSFKGKSSTAALVGAHNSETKLYIELVTNNADVTSTDGFSAAFVGYNWSSKAVNMYGCLNTGKITGTAGEVCSAIFCAYSTKGDIQGCLNTGVLVGGNTSNSLVGELEDKYFKGSYDLCKENSRAAVNFPESSDAAWLASGAFCYALNCEGSESWWFQTIGEDELPVLGDDTHKTVYMQADYTCDGTLKEGSVKFANEEGGTTDPHDFNANGACTHCGILDVNHVERDADGFYLVGDAKTLLWIADLLEQDNTISFKLTKDIDFSAYSEVKPMASFQKPFRGTFDGQFHRLKNLHIVGPVSAKERNTGFFSWIGDGAVVKNCIMDSTSSVKGGSMTGAFVGSSWVGPWDEGSATLECLGNEASIVGSWNTAGIIGNTCGDFDTWVDPYTGELTWDNGAIVDIKWCYNIGDITGVSECAAICTRGDNWKAGTYRGWYNTGCVHKEGYDGSPFNGKNTMGRNFGTYQSLYDLFFPCADSLEIYGKSVETQESFIFNGGKWDDAMWADGSFCYALNGDQSEIGWFQNIGEDPRPVFDPSHKRVYCIGELYCDGTPKDSTAVTWSNDGSLYKPGQHDYDETGVCTHCGALNENALPRDAEGYYLVATPEDFRTFYQLTKSVNTLKCRLTADIDFTDKSWTPMGMSTSGAFRGTIDGQGHRIKNLHIESGTANKGLVGKYGNGFTICNLIMDESCWIQGSSSVGAFAGSGSGDAHFYNLVNEATVLAKDDWAADAGGFIGGMEGGTVTIENSLNKGSVTNTNAGDCAGGFVGWSYGSNLIIRNCYNMGETKVGSQTCGGSVAGGDVSAFDNCYDISGQEGTTAIDASYLLSGELCYLLNGNPEESVVWTQTLGTDEYPIPFNTSKPVYLKGTINCKGEMEEGYEFCNEPGMSIYAEHECDENGICTVCGQADPEFLTPDENGFYHIAEAGQLLWFAGMAQGNGYLNAVLESDIELSGLDWMPIGNEGTPFCGTFDGQCHFIEGMAAEGENNVGFFGAVAGGATIKNLVISASCSVTAQYNAGGLIGAVVNGGSMVTIENCGNEATVNAESGNAGGILGNNVNACAPILMNNCYNLGDVTASGQAAGIGGSLGRAIVNNSWNKAAIESGDESNTFGNAATLLAENCYNEKVDNIEGVEKLAEESFTNGELCFLLNGGQTTNVVWYQTLGEDDYPVLDPSHKIVYLEEGEYTNNPTLIQLPEGNVAAPVAYYDLNGVRTETLRPGLNIVRFADGTVRKVFLK